MADLPVKSTLRKIKIDGVVYAEHPKTNAGNIVETPEYKVMTAAERTKLAGIEAGANKYSLPTATASILGGVKIGTNIDITNGVISVKSADASNLGLVKIGSNINVAGGVISVAIANGSTLGLAKAGTNVSVTNGEINVADANGSTKGVVKLSGIYNAGTPDANTALSQAGAKDLYQLIQNLESPIDYIGNNIVTWDSGTTRDTINTFIHQWLSAESPAVLPFRPGYAVLIRNDGNLQLGTSGGANAITTGYWLWIYDSINWNPSIKFPTIGLASAGADGLMSKSDFSKLKGIASGATKVEASTNGKIKINGTDTDVYVHPIGNGNNHLPIDGAEGRVLVGMGNGNGSWDLFADIMLGGFSKTTHTGNVSSSDSLSTAFSKLENSKQSKVVFTNSDAVVPANDGDIVIYYV